MKKSHIILPFLLIVVLSSCYTSKISYTNLNIIQRGMSSKEVISILGNPNYRNFDDKQEILEFRSSEYGTAKVAKIWFVDDRVIEMKSYLDSYENCHNRDNTTKENKKDKSSEEDTSSRIRVTPDGKHLIQYGGIIVTPERKHETVVSDQGRLIVTAPGKFIYAL